LGEQKKVRRESASASFGWFFSIKRKEQKEINSNGIYTHNNQMSLVQSPQDEWTPDPIAGAISNRLPLINRTLSGLQDPAMSLC
jgi:hypothetical protein